MAPHLPCVVVKPDQPFENAVRDVNVRIRILAVLLLGL
jgi:hypothetical protein